MADREKVLTWLKKCGNGGCSSRCPYDDLGPDKCYETLMIDALELLKEQQETIASLQGTIYKLNAALAVQSKQRFFVDSDGKITPLPIQKHGHWKQVEEGFTDMMCSECGELALLDLDRDFVLSKYCPNCGARMDEEVKQDADEG